MAHMPAGTPANNPLLQAALTHAAHGWAVHPLNGKVPYVGNWPLNATTDPETITRWWTENPGANVGIACMKSKLIVIDVDTKGEKKGADNLQALFEENEEFPETYTVQTWSGGLHYYFQAPEGVEIGNRPLTTDVDVRGGTRGGKNGGQVVAPPSVIFENGQHGTYRVLKSVRPALLPRWVVEILTTAPQRRYVPPKRPSAVPADHHTGEIPEGFQGTPERLRRRVGVLLQEIHDLPVGGPATQPVNDIALQLGHFVPHYLHEDEIRAELYAAVESWKDGHEKGYAAIETGLTDGMADPRPWEERRTSFVSMRTWDDFGNADRLVDRHGGTIRWLADTEQWAAYSGGRWTLKGASSAVWTHCVETIRAMGEGEAQLYPEDRRDGFLSFARRSRTRPAVAAMRDIAQADARIHATMDVFDRQRYLLNLRNGVYDLETGQLRPHEPELCLMQQARVVYDPQATAPRWERFLAQVMPDQARRDYLARVVGYTLTADTSEQCIFVHVGTGANGKSVFLDVVMAVMGEYAQSVPSSTLLASKGEGVPNDVARMVGKRLLSTVETSAGKKLDEELVKQLTGGDTISARFMRAEFFDFKPVGKIHLATNHLPHVGSGYGTARRLQDIGWDVTIPEEERDRSLAERIIEEELPGVLNWALRGYQDWRLQGLSVPEAVRERTAEHVASSDTIGMWLEENTAPAAPDHEIETTELFRNYSAWARAMEMKPMTVMSFSNALKERGIRKERSRQPHRRSVFFGLSIQKTVAPPSW